MNVLEQMRGGDVVHVEGRILAHEHDVEAAEVHMRSAPALK